jgi:hypothetical protein
MKCSEKIMDHDLYMFTVEEHQLLRNLHKPKESRKSWRVYGEKTNAKTRVTRRYFKCTMCREARHVTMRDAEGNLIRTVQLHAHASNCRNHHP